MIETQSTTAWYVFGIVPAGTPVPAPVDVVEEGSLAAVAAEVPLAEFGADVLPQRLEDRAWLEQKVRVHEDVLASFVGGAVVPLRFGALYSDVADLRRMLDERASFFSATLERLRGMVEIGVKAWLEPSAAVAETTPASGGRAYLEGRRTELARGARRGAFVQEAHERLLQLAAAGVVNRPQPRELTGRDEEMLLNAAYLVEADDVSVAQEVARLAPAAAQLAIALELTGPWAPYNFVDEDAE